MSELQRLKGLLPPELQSWVFVEAATAVDPPLVTCEEVGKDEVEIQVDLARWDQFALDQRNLLFWHEVGRIQTDTIPRDGWEMAALAIGLGGAVGELWVRDGLLLVLALGLSGFAGYRLYVKNNGERKLQEAIQADERAIGLATRFGYSLPNAYRSLGSALKTLVEQTPKKKQRGKYETRLQALRRSAAKAKAKEQDKGGRLEDSPESRSENVYG
jgi:Sec-independent protein translocase protein TatA